MTLLGGRSRGHRPSFLASLLGSIHWPSPSGSDRRANFHANKLWPNRKVLGDQVGRWETVGG